jgi:hypothetical protein
VSVYPNLSLIYPRTGDGEDVACFSYKGVSLPAGGGLPTNKIYNRFGEQGRLGEQGTQGRKNPMIIFALTH